MKVLAIGDIVGSPGRKAIDRIVPHLRRTRDIDFVIANAENAAGGSGVTPRIAEELFSSDIDVITSGDHIWKKKEIADTLDEESRILRPANYPPGVPGRGAGIYTVGEGRLGVINLVGRVFMESVECPFRTAKALVDELREKTPVIFVDMHAEATSEKIALGWYLDGRVSAVFGTHTHVQTADEHIYPKGTAFISDLGMTGPHESVIGRKVEQILTRFITQLPTRFQMAEGDVQLHGVIITVDDKTGTALAIERVKEALPA